MKLFFFFMLACLLQVSAGADAQTVSISGKNIPLERVFKEIQEQTPYVFFYDEDLMKLAHPVNVSLKNVSLMDVLSVIFKDQPLVYRIVETTVTVQRKKSIKERFFEASETVELQPVISGRVVAESGKPLEGVSVIVKGSNKGTSTNVDGYYTLNSIDEGSVLIFSMVGYQKQEITVKGSVTINVKLLLSITEQDEILIQTGYESISKERATGAFKVVTQKDLSGKMQPNILSMLEGMAAGFSSYKGSNLIRGRSTISGITSPLYVVDGFPYEGSLSAINPADIESVTFLKDATAASIYGARSANGVIVIQTKAGLKDRTVIEYDNSLRLTPLGDGRKYLNLMDSKELVDFQQEMFEYYHTPFRNLNPQTPINEVRELLYLHEAGQIDEATFNREMNRYRNTDNRQQIIDNLLRKTTVLHQHNLSLRGGSGKYSYAVSANYRQTLYREKAQKDQRVGFNVRNTYQFFKWLKVDFALIGSSVKAGYNNGFSGASQLYGGRPSYLNLFEDDGTPIIWYQGKSQSEIDRLIGLGLYDETYYPLDELKKTQYLSSSNYLNSRFGLNFQIAKGISFDVKYQMENTNSIATNMRDKDAYVQKNTINNATAFIGGDKVNYIPEGGYINERLTRAPAYTLRGQLNVKKRINEHHSIYGILGGERRAVKSNFTFLEKWGYDKYSLAHKYIDEILLSGVITGTESLNGSYVHYSGNYPASFGETENRFIAFYGNTSYEYNQKYVVTGSIRMDQSNLFGSDPKLQYKPLWSAGVKWKLNKEDFMNSAVWLDRLDLRATYGINGNIAKQSGPYLIVEDAGVNSWTQEYSSKIQSPPNSGLTWEKTRQTNFGLDFSVLKNRLSGSIDYYVKNTENLLGPITVDPTTGWSTLTLNYGSLFNRGVEFNLNSVNISSHSFEWRTILNFSYNKNQLTRLENSNNSVAGYINGAQTREGVPLSAQYNVRWAGLTEQGRPQAYLEDGKTIVTSLGNLSIEDLVYSGTSAPKHVGSLSNHFNYKGLTLSAMFIYYGGHVMRDVMPAYITNTESYTTNINKNILNYWKNPGDENDPDIAPAVYRNASTSFTSLWYAADKHIMKADYIKLRELILGYQLPDNLLQKTGFSSVGVNLRITDLFYWAANKKGYDPEFWNGAGTSPSLTLPDYTTYTIGLSINL